MYQAVYKKSARPARVIGEVMFGLHSVLLALKTGRREPLSLHIRGSKLMFRSVIALDRDAGSR